MSSLLAAVFFLLSCSLLLHACNGRTDFDHMLRLDPKSLIVTTTESNLKESETALALKTISTITTEHPIKIEDGEGRSQKNTEKVNSNVERRILHEENAANYDSNDVAEDVVVMDYGQPHRKPPIHNEEN